MNSKQPAAVAVEDVVGHADVHLEDGGGVQAGVQAAQHRQPAQDRFILRTARYVTLCSRRVSGGRTPVARGRPTPAPPGAQGGRTCRRNRSGGKVLPTPLHLTVPARLGGWGCLPPLFQGPTSPAHH